jgi:hypothetical protein
MHMRDAVLVLVLGLAVHAHTTTTTTTTNIPNHFGWFSYGSKGYEPNPANADASKLVESHFCSRDLLGWMGAEALGGHPDPNRPPTCTPTPTPTHPHPPPPRQATFIMDEDLPWLLNRTSPILPGVFSLPGPTRLHAANPYVIWNSSSIKASNRTVWLADVL